MGEELGACLPEGWHRAWGVQYPCLGDHSEMVARPGLGCKLAKSLHGVGGACLGSTTAGCLHTRSQQPRGQNYRELLGTVSAAGSVPHCSPLTRPCARCKGEMLCRAAKKGWTVTSGARHQQLAHFWKTY